MNPHENFMHLKEQAYVNLKQKGRSSTAWIFMLEATPFLFLSTTKGRLLQSVNTGMRLLDDVADGDMEPPDGFGSRIGYLEKKQAFIRDRSNPEDEIDHLFLYSYQLAGELGIDISGELDSFFTYFIFDAKRLGTGQIFSQAELDEAYDACDIRGTIRGCLKLFGDDPEKEHLLQPLGKAARGFYTLRDYEADIAAGLVNIPYEAFDKYGIDVTDLPNRKSPGVKAWFIVQATTGLSLLDEHRENIPKGNFRFMGKLALPIAYTRPARAYFEDVLAGRK